MSYRMCCVLWGASIVASGAASASLTAPEAFATAAASTSSRQTPQQVPAEMVLGLVKSMYQQAGMPEPEILVGRMPEDLRRRTHIPEGGRIYGAVLFEDRATAIIGVDLSIEDTKAALRREMPAFGWTVVEAFDNIGPQTQDAVLIPVAFCNAANESALALVDRRGGDAGRSLVQISYTGDAEGSICRPRPEPRRPQPPRTDLPRGAERLAAGDRLRLGDMVHPPTSPLASGRCLPGNSSSQSTISTELAAADIVEHYARQLEEAGWRRHEPGGAPPSATAAWEREIDGETTEVVLQVVGHPQREHCFSIRLESTWGRGR